MRNIQPYSLHIILNTREYLTVIENGQYKLMKYLISLFSARTTDIQLKTSEFTNVETLIGQNLTMVYLTSSRLQYCRFSDPSNNDLLLLPNKEYQSFNGTLYSYNGAGFAAGECGITVYNVTEQHNGNWTCIVGLPGEIGERRATFSVPIKGKYTASITFVQSRSKFSTRCQNVCHDQTKSS